MGQGNGGESERQHARITSQTYASHISEDGLRVELVATHLHEVSSLTGEFASSFNARKLGEYVGEAHDIGKYSIEFQNRILHQGPKVDHATAGAFELFRRGSWCGAYCVMGHHGGLPNGGTDCDLGGSYFGRLGNARRKTIPDYSAYSREVTLGEPPAPPIRPLAGCDNGEIKFSAAFFTRMLFSCLVDADYLCTERFVVGEARAGIGSSSIDELQIRFEDHIHLFFPPRGELNKIRCGVMDACYEAAELGRGVYSLTVPTGGGKTLASMRFALRHACVHTMERVIYAVPYTSIIEQNAEVFRRALGAENVLECHSNFSFDDQGELGERLRLASENWDAPIVVTTNVQFFESLYANKTSKCRKLHAIANSVIVLDEAQMIPTAQLLPCIRALVELVANYGCTVVVCTATQPALDEFFSRYGMSVREITPHPKELFSSLERVTYCGLGEMADTDLVHEIEGQHQALCIVNSRKQARKLFELLRADGERGIFHLTTLMTPVHRERVLARVRTALINGQECKVVATSLVEAGVDLDFPTVFRSMAGVDSIIQAAGRCNREGHARATDSKVLLFAPSSEYTLPNDVTQKCAVTRDVIRECLGGDVTSIGSIAAIDGYFRRLYSYRAADKERVLNTIRNFPENGSEGPSIPFADISDIFKIIDDTTISVVIPDEDVAADVEALRSATASRTNMRRISRYSVSLYENDVRRLMAAGAVEPIGDSLFNLLDRARYDEETGLDVKTEEGGGLYW